MAVVYILSQMWDDLLTMYLFDLQPEPPYGSGGCRDYEPAWLQMCYACGSRGGLHRLLRAGSRGWAAAPL